MAAAVVRFKNSLRPRSVVSVGDSPLLVDCFWQQIIDLFCFFVPFVVPRPPFFVLLPSETSMARRIDVARKGPSFERKGRRTYVGTSDTRWNNYRISTVDKLHGQPATSFNEALSTSLLACLSGNEKRSVPRAKGYLFFRSIAYSVFTINLSKLILTLYDDLYSLIVVRDKRIVADPANISVVNYTNLIFDAYVLYINFCHVDTMMLI